MKKIPLIFLFALAGITLFAQNMPHDFEYISGLNSITIIGYTGSASEVIIPERIEGLPVTVIGDRAFPGCVNLTSITIPGSVTELWPGAFLDCYNLTSITIQGNITSLPMRHDDYLPGNLLDLYHGANGGAGTYATGDGLVWIKQAAAITSVNTSQAREYFNRGKEAFNSKQYDLAISEYTGMLQLTSNNAAAYNNRGVAFIGIGDYDSAIADFETALIYNPDLASAKANLERARQRRPAFSGLNGG